MTTVDSCPKTLPMPSAPSWNSTTETHLTYTVSFRVLRNVVYDTGKKNDEKQIGEMAKDFTKMHF